MPGPSKKMRNWEQFLLEKNDILWICLSSSRNLISNLCHHLVLCEIYSSRYPHLTLTYCFLKQKYVKVGLDFLVSLFAWAETAVTRVQCPWLTAFSTNHFAVERYFLCINTLHPFMCGIALPMMHFFWLILCLVGH